MQLPFFSVSPENKEPKSNRSHNKLVDCGFFMCVLFHLTNGILVAYGMPMMKRVIFLMPQDLLKKIDLLCSEKERSRAFFIRKAIKLLASKEKQWEN